MSRHRVELKFDDGVYATLICPDDGSCKGADVCPRCGADLHDGQARRCYDCQGMDLGECWVKTWFDNCTADELLRGSLTVEIDAEWTGDEMVARLVAPDAGRDWTGECERCGGTGVLPGGASRETVR